MYHLGEVHRFWTFIVDQRATSPDDYQEPARPDDEDLLAWYRDGLARVHEVLAAADPATPVWTWSQQKDVAFVQRRMAQETAVHRWDAQLAAGGPSPIDPDLAIDGIDEFLDHFVDPPGDGATGSVHLHAGDAPGEWWVAPGEGGLDRRAGAPEGRRRHPRNRVRPAARPVAAGRAPRPRRGGRRGGGRPLPRPLRPRVATMPAPRHGCR